MSEQPDYDVPWWWSDDFSVGCDCPARPAVVITVRGDLDMDTSPRLVRNVQAHLRPRSGITHLTVDLAPVPFLSVRGLTLHGTMITTAQLQDVTIRLTGCRPRIREIIDLWQSVTGADLPLS